MTEPLTFAWLKSRALIALSGPDWRSFLQGLITQDVDALASGELHLTGLLMLGPHLTEQHRAVSP